MKPLVRRLLLLLGASSSLLPRGAWAEGSKQLTPNTPATAALPLTDPANTRSGYLTHDANNLAGTNTSLGFLKPAGFNYNGVAFSENHRMYVRVKAGETLFYGVHRTPSGQLGATVNQRDFILALRYGAGAGTLAQTTTLARNQLSANQSLLIDTQNGVIDDAAQAQAGPLPAAGGYQPLSYTNNTGADQEFYLEFTQVGEGTPGNYDVNFTAAQRFSTYDFWDFTVRTSTGVEQPGRLHTKLWSFSAGSGTGRFASTFSLLPLVPDPAAPTRYFVKKVELAGLNPQNFFRFVVNSRGTTASATDFTVSRKSQLVSSGFLGFPEFDSFIQNPDPSVWPSAVAPTFSVRSVVPFCSATGGGQLAFTTTSSAAGQLIVIVDLNGTAGYQPNTRDVVVETAVPAGTSTTVWNGLDGLGAAVPSGTSLQLAFQSGTAPMNFPLFDAENNADGFRVEDVRPAAGFNLLFWDDANLPVARFPDPRVNLGGQLSSAGVHPWGNTAAGQPFFDAGDQTIINTFTYGSLNVVNQAYPFVYSCDGDADGVTNANDMDWDNDGISNTAESGNVNPLALTANGAPTYLDAAYVHPTLGAFRDVNNDGINDVFDLDLDGRPNFSDIDADGDGITDVVEANASGAAVANYDTSTGRITGAVGANGMPDAAETAAENATTRFPLTNTDGASRPDFLDIDADNDGIPDNVEGQPTAAYRAPSGLDADGDGLDNAYDPTPGGAVAAGTALPLANTDGADQPDYRDADADNDGRPDSVEGWDTDNNGVANTAASGADADQDGLDDVYDTLNLTTTNAVANAQNGRLPTFYPDVNKPGGDRDWRQVLNVAPVANNATNAALPNSAGATALTPNLSGSDADGTVAAFVIRSLPLDGVLAFNGTPVTVGQSIPAGQLTQLTFDPASGFVGAATFTYTATDNDGLTSNATAPATYTIPVGNPPLARDDEATTLPGVAVTFSVAGNDQANGGTDINVATIDLNPATAAIDNTITTAEGTFTTVGVAAGSVQFTPVNASFIGAASTPYTIQNTAGVGSNQANLLVKVQSQLDLATTLTAPGVSVVAGSLLTLSGQTSNNSPAGTTATVSQSVQLPAGLSGPVTVSRDGVNFIASDYNAATGVLTFANLSLAGGASSPFSVRFTAPRTGPLLATAFVTPLDGDINLANNSASVALNVTPQTDLFTSITGPAANPVAGSLLTYAVTTGNTSTSSPALGVVQTVQVPAGLSGVFATNGGVFRATAGIVVFDGVSYFAAANTVTFPPVNLAAGQIVANSLSFAAPAAGAVLNAVTASVPTANEPSTATQANNTATATSLTVQPATANSANLYVSVAGPAQVAAGGTATYTVTQGNNGPAAASGVQTVVSLPPSLSAPALTLDGATGTLSADGLRLNFGTGATYTLATGRLVLPALSADQASAAAPQSYVIGLTPPTGSSTLTVTASVSSATTDPVPTNNMATTPTEVLPAADVAISLVLREGDNVKVAAGQPLTYFVQTKNNSSYPAQGVQQTVAIAPGLGFTDLKINGATGVLSGGVITFTGGASYRVASGLLTLPTVNELTNGVLLNTAISFPAPGYGGVRAVASVSSLTPDAVQANNTAAVSNDINQVLDLTVSLAGPAQAVAGNPVLYTVTTTNNGPSVTGTQTTTVQLPLGLSGVEVRDNTGAVLPGAYSASTGEVTFPATAVVPNVGQSVQGTISFVTPNVTQLNLAAAVTFTKNAGSNDAEANLDNNAARLSTALAPPAGSGTDLATAFTLAPTGAQTPRTSVSYRITTTNNGPAAAQNPVQLVSLPVGLTQAGLSLNGSFGTLSAGVISFGPGPGAPTYNVGTGLLTVPGDLTLASGATLASTVAFPMPAADLTLTANSTMSNADLNPANNLARATTLTSPRADIVLAMSGPATTTAGSTVNYSVVVTNDGPSTSNPVTATFTLPPGVSTYRVNGAEGTAAAGSTITLFGSNNSLPAGGVLAYVVSFAAPNATFTPQASVTTNTAGNVLSNDFAQVTTGVNIAPVANDVVNTLQSPQGNTAVERLPIAGLSATDANGNITVDSYTLTSVPDAATVGTLYVNGAAVTGARSLTLTEASQLSFLPQAGFVGSVSFAYTATDNGNGSSAQALASNPARYTIQVGADNASVYTATPPKSSVLLYQTNDVLAYVIDPNGALYNGSGAIYNATDVAATGAKAGTLVDASVASGLRTSATTVNAYLDADGTGPAGNTANALPPGTSLNPTTGQVFVSNASLLPKITTSTPYQVYVFTTDVNGGVNRALATFTLGASPLPVELTAFEANAVKQDAQLSWTTATEKNNDHFAVERSFDGTSFVKIGQVAGQGSKSGPTSYALTDAGIGSKASGPVYYRLRQVDKDGTSTYSPVRTVRFAPMAAAPVAAIRLYPVPVPAGAAATLDLTSLPANRYTVSLTDLSGRQLGRFVVSGGQLQPVAVSHLAAGSYLLTLSGLDAQGRVLHLVKRFTRE